VGIKKDKILVLANPAAGSGKGLEVIRKVSEKLENLRLPHRILLTEQDLNKLSLKKFEINNFNSLWVVGGDGTLNAILNHYGLPDIPIGLISAGTGNDFARAILETTDAEQQMAIALRPNMSLIDIGYYNNRFFATGLGIGFDGLIAHKMKAYKGILSGSSAYYAAVLASLPFYDEKKIKIETNDQTFEDYFFMVTVGNTKYFGGGFKVTPHANPADGVFDINIIGKTSIGFRFFNLKKVENGTHLSLTKQVQYLHSPTIKISCSEKLPCHADGETFYADELDISILPKALKIKTRLIARG
jgi:diacylglycerol kinase (ATP)